MLQSSGDKEIDAAFERCKNSLKLKDGIDPFVVFANLDESLPEPVGELGQE